MSRAHSPRRLARIFADPAHRLSLSLIALSNAGLLLLWLLTRPQLSGFLALVGGFFLWTFAEYWLHRVLFHLPAHHPLAVLGARIHAAHHERPEKAPITKPPALTLGTLWLLFGAASWLLPGWSWAPLFAGAGLGYFSYELLHVAAHTLSPQEHPFPSVQRHHLDHHLAPRRHFGISSPLWDLVFRT
jgi:hypothetical protein